MDSEKLPMMDRGSPKHVEFFSKNKFEKLVHIVGFTVRKQSSVSLEHKCNEVKRPFTML